MSRGRWWCLVLLVALVGCGHQAKLRPAARQQVEVEVELGGPFAKVGGAVLPLPLSTVGASYGIADHLDVSGHLHPTAAIFGVAGLDVGGSWQPLIQRGPIPAVTLLGRLYGFTDFKSGFIPYLEVGATGSYQLWERLAPYLNISALVQINAVPLFAVGAGLELQLGRVALQAEFRWYSPNRPTVFNVVEWQSIGGLGAFGVLLGTRVKIGDPQ